KPRTYDEAVTEGRLSACSTLRLLHRVLLRMLAPYLPYITEEVWHWHYANDADMNDSIHRSPWPSLDEIAAIPEPPHARIYDYSVVVMDAVRKAKAEA